MSSAIGRNGLNRTGNERSYASQLSKFYWRLAAALMIVAAHAADAANITEYPLGIQYPTSITEGPDSLLWVTHFTTDAPGTNTPGSHSTKISKLDTQGNITVISIPGVTNNLLARADGNMWFIPSGSKSISHVTTSGQQLVSVVAATDISVRISSGQSASLHSVAPNLTTLALQPAPLGSDGKIGQTNLPSPGYMTEGPDHTLWYTLDDGTIGHMDSSGNIQQFQIRAYTPLAADLSGAILADVPSPGDIVAGPDGAMWITDTSHSRIYRMTTDGQSTEYKGYVANTALVPGADGALWFVGGPQSANPDCRGPCVDSQSLISRITTDGKVTTYTVNGNPQSLIAGKNNDFWYTENVVTGSSSDGPIQYGAIGHITTSGVITDYKISDNDSQPGPITIGPDSNVWFVETKDQKVGVLDLSDNAALIPVHISGLYSSSQGGLKNQSFLRFTNTQTNFAGSVTITLFDANSGATLGQWISPVISAGTSKQFAMSQVESNTIQPIQNKPAMYTALIQPQFEGRLQHIVWDSTAGILSNLSMCSRGTDTAPTQLSFVHTTINGDQGYPSSVVVTNTGGIGQSVTLIVNDANDGSKIGEYVTPLIPKNGQYTLTMDVMEAALKFKPQPSQIYYAITAKQPFTGYLQHLLTNVQSNSVITDLSTACVIQPGIG